jgi:sulfatase maturation enzyme AslB (radical SAM superfamily)
MRINNSGHYEYCRWAHSKLDINGGGSVDISSTTPVVFFQQHMVKLRQNLLDGDPVPGCANCNKMELHGKISGRQRQLLKIGVTLDHFEKSLASSPWRDQLTASTDQLPVDWQIDLGNYCNSACLFCSPRSSSRLATEWKKIGLIDKLPVRSWCDDPVNLQTFIDTLILSPKLTYLHFIGGETLITPAFKKILVALIHHDLHKDITIGFTTNLISWDQEVVDLLTKFLQVNVGMSIESFASVNNYARWPACSDLVKDTLFRWLELRDQHNWIMTLRTTPTVLTIGTLTTVFDFAYQHKIPVESCNFLDKPEYMRPTVLPQAYRDPILAKLKSWVEQHNTSANNIINTRDPNIAQQQVVQDAESYINYLEGSPDESHRLPDLVKYLKTMDSNRNNSVFNYLPEYENLFRSSGY